MAFCAKLPASLRRFQKAKVPSGSPSTDEEDNQEGCACVDHVSREFLGFLIRPKEELPEVEIINNYAVFMGYLSMAVRGLGFLVVTWTTVVLLGGFVSVLGKKDFWCLTVITLSQTVGVFDVFLNEKLGSIWHAYRGLFITSVSTTIHRANVKRARGGKDNIFIRKTTSFAKRKLIRNRSRENEEHSWSNCWKMFLYMLLAAAVYTLFWVIVSLAKAAVQALLFAAVLFPLATLYMFGLYISTSISLWRLIQHDYGDDGGANMKPALNVLYSLTVVQGLVFCYRIIFARQERSMVVLLARSLRSDDDSGDDDDDDNDNDGTVAVTWDYLRETKIGCEKDPSFASGRNLVTYAMDLIESRSPDSYLSGTRALDMLLKSEGHGVLIWQLIACGESSHALHKLLGTLGPGSPYCGETRTHARSIVAHLASQKQIRLAQFPGGIHLISSMLDHTSLVEDGLRILGHLADDEGNRIVMSNTPGLVSSIIAPLGSGLHLEHCREWDIISSLLSRLTAGEMGLKLRSEISRNHRAVGALDSILKCGECSPQDRIKANDILADLSMEMTPSEEYINGFQAKKEENLVRILIDNFIHVDRERDTYSVRFAGSKLAELSLQSKSSAQLILKADDDVAANLVTIVQKEASGSTSAAEILNNLCSHYSKDDMCFDRLKKALTDAMPKVLGEMLPRLTGQEIRAGTEGHYKLPLLAPGADSEIGCAPQENTEISEEVQSRNLKEALKFFCSFARICDQLISKDHQDLSRQFDEIAAVICLDSAKPVRTLASLVQEAHETLKAIEAQEALDEKKRAEERENLPQSNRPKRRGILDCFFPRTTSMTDEALEEKMWAEEQENRTTRRTDRAPEEKMQAEAAEGAPSHGYFVQPAGYGGTEYV